MESLPELENLTTAQDRPKSKWKRPVFWGAFVILLLANVCYVAITWLPRWAPRFAAEYVRHPTALARAVATQLEHGDSDAAQNSIEEVHTIWFAPRDRGGNPAFPTWVQHCFRNLFLRGDPWEKMAVLRICDYFSCPGCFDVIAAEIPKLDTTAKKFAAGALGRTDNPAAIPELEKLLSDSAIELRLETVRALQGLGFSVADAGSKSQILKLLRGVFDHDADVSVRECAARELSVLRSLYWRDSARVMLDDELSALLRSPFESARAWLSEVLVAEQCSGRLDTGWYPLLNEVFARDTSERVRGNAALVLILADDPQSAEKLKFIESLCNPESAPLPLTKEKILMDIRADLSGRPTMRSLLNKWTPKAKKVKRLTKPTGPEKPR